VSLAQYWALKATSQPRDRRSPLVAAAAGSGAPSPSSPEPNPPPPAQQRFATAYGGLAVLFAGLGAVFAVNPGWAVTFGLGQAAPSAATVCFMGVFASYCIAAAGCFVCLKGAASAGRLSSDTYKRLNLGAMYTAVIATVLQLRALATGVSNPALACGYLAVCLPTIITTASAYRVSNAGVLHIPAILKGFAAGAADMLRPRSPLSALYAATMLALAAFWPVCTFTDLHPLVLEPMDAVGVYVKRKAGCGMLLLLVMHYVLKDAAERGRLGASTFRALHLTLAAVCCVAGYWFLRMSQAVPVQPLLMNAVLAQAAAQVLFFDWQFLMAKSTAS